MTDRSEYAPINGARGGASSSPMVTALLVVIAVLSLVIIALCVILYQNDQNLRNDIKKVQPPAPFTNLDFTKDDLTNYYTTQHFPIVAGLVSQWTTYLQNFLQGKNPAASKMAVVFDIDETSLNNYPYYAPSSVSPQWGVDYGYVVSSWYGWVNSASAEAIAPVKTLYMTLQSLGVETIFITGRRDTQVPITETNLAAQGYTNYTTLITRPPQWYNATAEAYKSFFRQQLTTQGYNIIGCIGDQISDCNNGYAGYIMKIPNYIYYIE